VALAAELIEEGAQVGERGFGQGWASGAYFPRSPRRGSPHGRQGAGTGGVQTLGVAEPARADAGSSEGVVGDVEDDVVRTGGIAADPADPGEEVETQEVAHPPGDVVVGARGIPAGAHRPHHLLL